MTVEELHGVFQFTDDLFDDAAPVERVLTVDKCYNPRVIFPGWFESGTESIPTAHEAKNPIDTVEYLLPELYRRGEYENCLSHALKRIKIHQNAPGILRDAAETAALCLLKLNRPNEALPLLPLMTGVEEPGRLIVRSRVFFECGRYVECAQECREYLKLRPADYSITIRLAECNKKLFGEIIAEETNALLDFAESTLKSYIEQTGSGKLYEKYCRDLSHLQTLRFK